MLKKWPPSDSTPWTLTLVYIAVAHCKTYMQWIIVASIRSFHDSLTKAMMMLTIFLWLELRFLVGYSIFLVHYIAWNNIQTYLVWPIVDLTSTKRISTSKCDIGILRLILTLFVLQTSWHFWAIVGSILFVLQNS